MIFYNITETEKNTNDANEKAAAGEGKKDKKEYKEKEEKSKENFFNIKGLPPWLLLPPLLLLLFGPNLSYRTSMNTITFQQFRIHMLERGIVDHIEVINKSVARVFLRKDLDASQTNQLFHENDGPPRRMSQIYGAFNPSNIYEFNIGSISQFEEKLEHSQIALGINPADWVPVQYVNEISIRDTILHLLTSGPILTLFAFWWIIRMFRKNAPSIFGGSGSGAGSGRGFGGVSSLFDIARANPQVLNKGEKVKTRFADVAGMEAAKEEVAEFVKFLKDPESFTRLGARIPKGALLTGPPGCGKTLLARAVAGEAECPFYSISGSDFVEMFVGVGPSRVRSLFEEARKNAPCIIFIDEIDAVGRKRSKGGYAGSNDERENTLNQLLVEMDGFKVDTSVVVLAGTNRADILDSALLRPGRFDRQVTIDKPDMIGRVEIFKVHLKKIKLKESMSDIAQRMATLTPGFTGADIANVVNEAALRAARKNLDYVTINEFYEANDRVIAGLEKRMIMSTSEKELIAHHEAGHAVAGWFLEHAEPLLKVTVIPRANGALGFAQYLPKEVQLYTFSQLYDMMCMALGGRAAEEIFFSRVSTGAADDLSKVTKIAYSSITVYGMNERLGNMSFPPDQSGDQYNAYRPYSEKTAEIIDEEAKKLISNAYSDTLKLLKEKKSYVSSLAAQLLEKETINHDDIVAVLGERPFKNDAYREFLKNTEEFEEKYQTKNADILQESETENESECEPKEMEEDKNTTDNDTDIETTKNTTEDTKTK